jgi:hypothetical protein
MFNMSIKLFSLIAIVLFAPECGTGKSANTKPMEPGQWTSVRMAITGGFTGRGNGAVLITSDGKITVEQPSMPGKQSPPCEGKLAAVDLKRLNDAISRSHPDTWNKGGVNVAAPDAFGYVLGLTMGTGSSAKMYTAKWYDNTHDQLPEDLKAVSDAVSAAMQSAKEKCK